SDARIQQVLREAARRGLKPQDDRELLPVLLDLLHAKTPVSAWPSQWTKAERTERARELARARAAAADRPAAAGGLHLLPAPAATGDLARQNRRAIDADRRRRREEAVTEPLAPPPTLGEDLHARSLFSLTPDHENDSPHGPKEGEVS
ncbi:transposase, partial [Streptomyces sp. NPDC006879]